MGVSRSCSASNIKLILKPNKNALDNAEKVRLEFTNVFQAICRRLLRKLSERENIVNLDRGSFVLLLLLLRRFSLSDIIVS
jgi:hypothetical protein